MVARLLARRLLRSRVMPTTEDLIAHVAAHAGCERALAAHAAREVLATIGGYLPDAERARVADELPAELAATLRATAPRALPVTERLLGAAVSAARARELIASVGRVLAETLSRDAIAAITAAAPPELAELVVAPAPARDAPRPGSGRSLATGRPGSAHPVSEARDDRTQDDSVARDANPHAGRKLSSGRPRTSGRG